jgi:hypothetical protein
MSAVQEREQEVIIGQLTGIVQKGPDKWQAVVVPDGSQYNKNLWTKDASLLPYLQSQIGNRLAFQCNVSHWTNQSNQPVRSLWIEVLGAPNAAGPAGPLPQAASPPQQAYAQPPQQPTVVQPTVEPMVAQAPQPDLREKKIHRQTAAKVAATLLGYLPEHERTMATLLVLSERLVAYFDNGLPAAETLDDLMNRAMPSSMPDKGMGYDNSPPPHTDDDIPF